MDPIFDRLGRLFRSNNPFSGSSEPPLDEDERAAFEELEAELNAPKGAPRKPSSQGNRTFQQQRRQETAPPSRPALDPVLVQAYAALGLSPSATWDEVNAAHRTMLKKHHPDRHAGNEALLRQATAQSQKINEAYQLLKKTLAR
jgi:DnaJ-domain-containing protein 1